MQRRTLALLALVPAILVVWWFSRASSRQGLALEPGTASAAASSTEQARTGEHLAGTEEAETVTSRAPLAEANDTSKPELPPAEPPLEVLVLAGTTDVPVAGAEVFFLDYDALTSEQSAELSSLGRDRSLHFARFGTRSITNEKGIARVPRPLLGALVAAAAQGTWGEGEVRANARTHSIVRLSTDVSLRVRVVDAVGRAIGGFPVALRTRDAVQTRDVLRTSAANDGVATLHHVHIYQEDARDSELLIALSFLGATPVEQLLDPDFIRSPPENPFELVAPETGSVAVRVARPAGLDPRASLFVALALAPPSAADGALTDPGRSATKEIPGLPGVVLSPTGPEAAVFEHVALGLELVATVRGNDFEELETRVAGPTAPGERVTILANIGAHVPVLVGRLVAAPGEPLASTQVAARLIQRRGMIASEHRSTLRTNQDGVFRYLVEQALEAGASASLSLELRDGDARALEARVELPTLAGSGEIQLGDVWIRELPKICAGRVVDESGAPIAGVTLALASKVVPPDRSEEAYWSDVMGFSTRSTADGSFELRGACDRTALCLHLTREGHSEAVWHEFAPGAADLTIVLPATGALIGWLQLPRGLRPGDIELVLVDEANAERARPVRPADDGTFTLVDATPGSHTLRFGLRQEHEALGEIHGLVVDANGTTRDPRLDPWDVSALARAWELRVQDELGRPLPDVAIALRGDDGRWSTVLARAGEDSQDGRRSLVTSRAELELLVWANASRAVHLEHVDGDRDVVLRAGIPLRVRLVGLTAEAWKDRVLELELAPTDPTAAELESIAAQLAEDGTAELAVRAPGGYRPRIYLRRKPDQAPSAGLVHSLASMRAEVELAGPTDLEVRDSASRQDYEIRVDAAAIDRASESLERSGG